MSLTKNVPSVSSSTTGIARPNADTPTYSTGRGCLTMTLILVVLLGLSIAGIVLFGNQTP